MKYTTLSEAVKRYLAISGIGIGNNDEIQFMIRGVEVWKTIRNNILRLSENQWIKVNKSMLPYYIDLPECCDKFLVIGKKNDCGQYVPFAQWSDMVTKPMPASEICTCESGIKECIETYEEKIEPVTISAGTFNKTTKKRVYENGNVYIETSTPADKVTSTGSNNGYEYINTKDFLCKLDTNPCGCIVLSQENLNTISQCCCQETVITCKNLCNAVFTQPEYKIGLARSEAGYFSYEMQNNKVYLYGDIPEYVLVGYQTSGDNPDEENMPSFVLEAFYAGMDYFNTKYSKTKDRFEKAEADRQWKIAQTKLNNELPRNMIDSNMFHENSQNIFYTWG